MSLSLSVDMYMLMLPAILGLFCLILAVALLAYTRGKRMGIVQGYLFATDPKTLSGEAQTMTKTVLVANNIETL